MGILRTYIGLQRARSDADPSAIHPEHGQLFPQPACTRRARRSRSGVAQARVRPMRPSARSVSLLLTGLVLSGCSSSGGTSPDTTLDECKAFMDYTRSSFRSLETAVPQAQRAAAQDALEASAIQTKIADALDAVAKAPPRFTSPLVSELEARHKASYATRARALRRANEGLVASDQAALAEAKTLDAQADQELGAVLKDYEQKCAQAAAGSASSPTPATSP